MEKSYTIIYQGNILSALNENGINRYMILNEVLAVIYVDQNFNDNVLNTITEVSWWQISKPMSSLINITNNVSQGESVTVAAGTDYIYNNPYINASGQGVLIAIIDSGIDYLHPDFIKNDNTSKIISLWDQESDRNSPPEGMIFGSEFTREEINEAILNGDSSLSVDNIGTGTIAAGISSGNGRLNPLYRGVAINSELVVVKLRQHEGVYQEGRINYINTDFLAAIKYVIDISQRENKLTVINLTVAERSVSFLLTNLLDTFTYLNSTGVVVVGGAGNEGNTDIHYEGFFQDDETPQDIILEVSEQKSLEITISPNGPGRVGALVISPSGEISYKIMYAPDDSIYSGRFNLENASYEMRLIYPWLLSGNQELTIRIDDIKPGIWTLRLFPEIITSGEYDIYLPNQNLIPVNTRFLDPNSYSTITLYASTENVITIGAYNDKTNSMWIGSSKGPVKGRFTKPDIVAPGVDIISPFINQSYTTSTGTGVSSSLVCGVLAIIMEYLAQQGDYSRRALFTNVLKTYLMRGATKNNIYTYPNSSQGYGILNLQSTMMAIADNL